MKGLFGKDASGRFTYECLDVTLDQYLSIRDHIIRKFEITPIGNLVQGLNEIFQDFQKGKSVIGIEWDVWSGLCIVAKTPDAVNLIKDIDLFFQNEE